MNLQGQIAVSIVLFLLVSWMLSVFSKRKLASAQVLFWLILLVGAEVCTLSPPLVDFIGSLWGNLVPVSWISLLGIVALIFYLLFQSIEVNELRSSSRNLAREVAFLERRLRSLEDPADADDSA